MCVCNIVCITYSLNVFVIIIACLGSYDDVLWPYILQHEASCGRTSSISYHIMGFDQQNQAVHQPVAASAAAAAKNKAWRQVVESSRSIVTFIDLAGTMTFNSDQNTSYHY